MRVLAAVSTVSAEPAIAIITLRQILAMILRVSEAAVGRLGRIAELFIGERLGQFGELISGLNPLICAGRIRKEDLQIQIEQVRNRGERLGGDLVA